MVTVLTAGHVNWDVTLTVDRLPEADGESRIRGQRSSGGGSAANVAVTLAGLDVDTGVVGSVGDDQNGVLAKRELAEAGVDRTGLHTVADAETAVKYLLVDENGEVAVLGNDGVNEAVTPEDVDPSLIEGADSVHLTSQRPETAAYIAETASAAGVTVSVDPGRRIADRDFGATLEHADVIFLNDREAEAVLEDEYPSVEYGDSVLVLKRGDEGATVHTPDGTYVHPGFDVEPVDTTGAGDAFAAGYIATKLRTGDDERALEFANACGALAATVEGARPGLTTEQVESFLDGQF